MKKFKIHYSFIIVFICFIFSKFQIEYLCFLLCIFIHEFGHLIALRINNINIKKMTLFSFGLIMSTDDYKGFSDEIIIYSAGIIFNLILLLLTKGIINDICKLMILINLLPIYPLDGYNILESIIAYFIPYKYTMILMNIISIISIFVVMFLIRKYLNLMLIINCLYLIFLSFNNLLNVNKIYNMFVINRALYDKELEYKTIKFNEKLHERLYKYKKIKVNIANNEVLEKKIIYSKYKI